MARRAATRARQPQAARRELDVSTTEAFEQVSERLLAEDASLERGRMFGSAGLKSGGKVFAMVVKGDLVVKLPAERVDELLASGSGRPFDPGHGRLLKEWVALQPADAESCEAFAREARRFVEAQAKR